ncbi:hypothetical protein BGX26_000110 [Mortierella sp. AD094]|nr:hypothetical protein BGX26_000110 [Mortierella sp. AD094]
MNNNNSNNNFVFPVGGGVPPQHPAQGHSGPPLPLPPNLGQGQDDPSWRDFLRPEQRQTIDWYEIAPSERYHSRNYDPHQGVPIAENWRLSPMNPVTHDTVPTSGVSSIASDSIGVGHAPVPVVGAGPVVQAKKITLHVSTSTSLLNPVPQGALEPFHRRQLEDWNAGILAYGHSHHHLMERSRILKAQYDGWLAMEESLNSSVDNFQRLVRQIHGLDGVLETMRESSLSVSHLFSLVENAQAMPTSDFVEEETTQQMEARLLGSNNYVIRQVAASQAEIVRFANEEKLKIRSLRLQLGLLDVMDEMSNAFSMHNLNIQHQGPYAGFDLFAVLKAPGRANELSDMYHRPELAALEAEVQAKCAIVKANENELERRLYFHNMALDLATPKNGAQVKRLKSIESPIALQMFNTSSVCQVERLEIDLRRTDWIGEFWRIRSNQNVMPASLRYSMEMHQGANNNSNNEAMNAERCLEIGCEIVARNWRSLEEVTWRGSSCRGCFIREIDHECDRSKPCTLDVGPILQRVQEQEHAGQDWQQPREPAPSNFCQDEFAVSSPVLPPEQSRLVVLNLQDWRFTRTCLNSILESCPHLLSLELKQCILMRDAEAESEEAILPSSSSMANRNNSQRREVAPVFQHRGLRSLAISMSTLFTQQRQHSFYSILRGREKVGRDDEYLNDSDSEVESSTRFSPSNGQEGPIPDGASDSSFSTSSSYESIEHKPRTVTRSQVEAIDLLESSLFEHFPNLEHWKLTPGMENFRMVTWIGREVQRHCPNLNKLTIAPDAFVDSECTALLVRAFRPMPEHQLSTGLNSAIVNIPLREENDSDNIFLRGGYRLANGKGLKVFRAEEDLYGRALVKALMLHTSTLEVLDLDSSNEYWNLWPGQVDGEFVRTPRSHTASRRSGSVERLPQGPPLIIFQDAPVHYGHNGTLGPPPHASQVALVNGQGIGLGYGNQLHQNTSAVVGPNQGQPAPGFSALSPAPSTQSSDSDTASVYDEDEDEDAYQGPWVLRRPYSHLDALLQQCTRLRQVKLPRNEIDVMQAHMSYPWRSSSTLEELWISVHGLYCTTEIAQILNDIRAVPVRIFERLHDRYDNPEGVVPLAPRESGSTTDNYGANSFGNSFASSSQFQEYMDRNLYPEDHHVQDYEAHVADNENNGQGPEARVPTPPIPGTLRYQVIQLLRQFTRLRSIWIGEGLYLLPPRAQDEQWQLLQSNGPQEQVPTVIPDGYPTRRGSVDMSDMAYRSRLLKRIEIPLFRYSAKNHGRSKIFLASAPASKEYNSTVAYGILGEVPRNIGKMGLKRRRSENEFEHGLDNRNIRSKYM